MTLALPYRDDSRTTLAFSLAVLLHVLLGMAIVVFFLFKPTPEPTPSKVFELVAAPPSDSQVDETAAPGPPSLSLPTLPAPNIPTPPQPVEPTPAQPTPVPTPAVVTPPPRPAPTLSHAPTVVSKPPTHQAETPYQAFLREHHLSSTPSTASPPHATGRLTPSVSVNVSSIVTNLENAGSGSHGQTRGRANAASSAQEQDYLDKLRERLKEAFVPPGGISGLSAEIQLVIAPDGQLVMKRLTRSSGKAEFDDAVREALQQLTNVDPPPGGVQVSYNFTYTPDGQQ